jgi:hypothetical protein
MTAEQVIGVALQHVLFNNVIVGINQPILGNR